MKKKLIAALLVAILASTMVFAEVSLSGEALASFGYDFDEKELGFVNTNEAKAKFDAVAKTSANEGDVYAEIKATLELKLSKGLPIDATDLNTEYKLVYASKLAIDYAKIVGPNWYVGILGCMKPADLAASFEYNKDDDVRVNYALSAEKPAGIEVGIDNIGTFGIGLEANLNDTATAERKVLLTAKTADFEVAEGFKLTAAATYAYDRLGTPKNVVGGGVKVAYAKDALSLDVAADLGVEIADETKVNADAAANVGYNNIKASLYFATLVTSKDVTPDDANAIKVAQNTENYLSAKLVVDFRDFDLPFCLTVLGQDLINTQYLDANFDLFVVEGLTLSANGGYHVDPKAWHAGAGAKYVFDGIGTLEGKVNMAGNNDNAFNYLTASVSLTNETLVSGATLKAAYESGNYLAKDDTGKSNPGIGKVFVSAKIKL